MFGVASSGCSVLRRRRISTGLLGCIALFLGAARETRAQAIIKVNDDVNIKFGALLQTQADWLQDAADSGYAQNLFIRRFRLLVGGQVAKNVTFFAETDSPNINKVIDGKKNTQTSVFMQDAYAEWKVCDGFALDAGLMLLGPSRNNLQSAASLLAIDYGPYTFTNSGPTQSNIGRDTGFQAKGYLAANHLEYRVGAFSGIRDAGSHNAFRTSGRLQYDVFDTETAYFYPGTSFGKKKILAFGGGFDLQKDYKAYAGDATVDFPIGPGVLTSQFDYQHFDGGKTLTTLPKQNDIYGETGFYFSALKIEPVIWYAWKNINGTDTGDEARYSAGLNWWYAGHNANIKLAYTRLEPRHGRHRNEVTLQMQAFYF